MERVERIEAWCGAAARRIAVVSVAGMLVLSLLTALDIILRSSGHLSVPGFLEFTELMIAVAVIACFPASTMLRSNLVVDIAGHLLSERARRRLAVLGDILLLIILALLAWRFAVYASEMQERGQTTAILEIPKAPFFWAGAAFMALTVPLQAVSYLANWKRSFAPPRPAGADVVLGGTLGAARRFGGSTTAAALVGIAGIVAVVAVERGGVLPAMGRALGNDPIAIGGVFFAAMWVMIFLLVPVGAAMSLAGIAGLIVLLGTEPAMTAFGFQTMHFIANSNFAVIPLFLMMGNLASVAGLSGDIYRLAYVLLGHRRGGVALATIGGCAGFGAITGSSVATAITMGAVTLPEMRQRGYSPALSTGCIAAGGTLGQLVPPSTIIVIYCILVEVSIGQTFIAALVPALITAVLYMVTVSLFVRLVPGSAPPPHRAEFGDVVQALKGSWGVIVLFGLVVGGIYGGFFTATEAAAVGAGTAFLFALGRGKLGGGAFWRVMGETAATTGMVYLLIIGAVTFSFFMGVTQFADRMTAWILDQDLTGLQIIAILLVVYLLLGTVMESHAILVITVPIVASLIVELGYDLIWWGIIMVVVVEMGLITPPFGINVFVIRSLARDIPLSTMYRGVTPFILADVIKLVLLVLFPGLILWLPQTMMN